MTVADPAQESTELEECAELQSGQSDHLLAGRGECERLGYQRQRTAGFVYAKQQPGTQPLYRCITEADRSSFASNRNDCEGLGRNMGLLGYDPIH